GLGGAAGGGGDAEQVTILQHSAHAGGAPLAGFGGRVLRCASVCVRAQADRRTAWRRAPRRQETMPRRAPCRLEPKATSMLRITSIIGAWALLALPQAAAAEDAQIGCFSDGDYVYLHGGLTYQYFIDKGDKPVDCPPDAVKIGLELAEEAVQVSCVTNPDNLCDEKKQYVALIHRTYDKMLNGSAPANPAPDASAQAAATAP